MTTELPDDYDLDPEEEFLSDLSDRQIALINRLVHQGWYITGQGDSSITIAT